MLLIPSPCSLLLVLSHVPRDFQGQEEEEEDQEPEACHCPFRISGKALSLCVKWMHWGHLWFNYIIDIVLSNKKYPIFMESTKVRTTFLVKRLNNWVKDYLYLLYCSIRRFSLRKIVRVCVYTIGILQGHDKALSVMQNERMNICVVVLMVTDFGLCQ